MNVLVDTSVWVGHFKRRNEHLVALLESGMVVCHPFVVVEVACGSPPSRQAAVSMLGQLASMPVATTDEVLDLIERRNLSGRGCGFVDMSLLVGALLGERTLIWTLDKRLESVATESGRSYGPAFRV